MSRRSVVIGTAGHIDHGKSALVQALTGIDPDRLKEEKARGITIDLGFARWQAGEVDLAFVDVPGHERFVKNMLAGVGGIDLVMLVVAADESVMPQTREHFEICRLLQIPAGLIAITKIDLADEEMIELVREDVRDLVAGSRLEKAPIVPVSARTGAGLPMLREVLAELAARTASRTPEGAARLPIDRVFSMRGFGTVVTGTLVAGGIRRDDDLVILPSGRVAKVRGIEVHGEPRQEAVAGQRVAVNLGGVEVTDLARGDTLAMPGTIEPTTTIDAWVESIRQAKPLRHGTRVRFHQGTAEVLGRVAIAGTSAQAAGTEGERDAGTPPRLEIAPGGHAYVRLRLEAAAVVTRGDRFILRAYSPPVTIGGGLILDPKPPARQGVRGTEALARFARLDPLGLSLEEATDRAVASMVDGAHVSGLPVRELTARAGIAPAARTAVIARLTERGLVQCAGDRLVAPAVVTRLEEETLSLLAAYHRSEPLLEGMAREELRERLFARAGAGVFEHVLDRLVARGQIVARDRVALATHRVTLSGSDDQACHAVEEAFERAGLRPPDPAMLASEAGLQADTVDRVIKLLLRRKTLVRVGSLLFHERALRHLREDLATLQAAAGAGEVQIDVGTFKDRYGVTRKFAIPLLEYLDRERITRRVGDSRVLIPRAG